MLLGDEAIAQAALDAGISGVYAYPGTPSTEITEYIMKSPDGRSGKVRAGWSTNEKTAMEAALGMSYAGKRAMVCMKHVGLNVAADAFMNSAVTGVNGGLIVISADDPSMHSSQNEQDSRVYAKFAFVPILEPSNQQEAYDMIRYGFDLSENIGLPIMLRITTRLAHSRSGVKTAQSKEQNKLNIPDRNAKQFILLPGIARKQYKSLLEKQNVLTEESVKKGFNKIIPGNDKSLGIITTGIAYNYLLENFEGGKVPYPVCKIVQYPFDNKMIAELYNQVDKILVLEEGYPVVEEALKGILNIGKTIHGRLDGTVPRDGELNPNIVAVALDKPDTLGKAVPGLVAARPPSLCNGCPHIFSYKSLNEAVALWENSRVFADIGCYTLGALPPYNAINTCVDMGASITMAKGAADAGLEPAIAVIGDSTFTHSGITGLIDCVRDKSNVTILILDNETTAMTGGQDSAGTGRLEQICLGVGVEKEHIITLNPVPKDHQQNFDAIKKELEYKGVSVIIPRRECLQTALKSVKKRREESNKK